MWRKFAKKLLPNKTTFWWDLGKTVLFWILFTLISFLIMAISGDANNASDLYLLCVLVISLHTDGYFWGLVGAVMGVSGTNFLFTYPYYALDFSLGNYPVTFLCMLVVAAITGTLMASIKGQRDRARRQEKRTQTLHRIGRELFRLEEPSQIARMAVQELVFIGAKSACFLLQEDPENPLFDSGSPQELTGEEWKAIRQAFAGNVNTGSGTVNFPDSRYFFAPVSSGKRVLAVAGMIPGAEKEERGMDGLAYLHLILSQFTMALERLHLEKERQQVLMDKEKEQLRGNLLRGISHDLRTPLTGIIGASSALLENEARISPESRRQLLEDIDEDANWLLHMVENVLSITRINQEEGGIQKVPEAMEEVVAQAANRCRKRLPGLLLRVYAPDEFLMAPMDGTLIEQVLINLIENAYRYGDNQKPINVRIRREGKACSSVCGITGGALIRSFCPPSSTDFPTSKTNGWTQIVAWALG